MVKKTMIFLLAGAAIFTACKKSDTTTTTTAQKVVAKWTIVSDNHVEVEAGVSYPFNYNGVAGDYADFRNDGKVYAHIDGSYDTSTYKIISDASIKFEKDTFQIKTLTTTSFIIYKGMSARDSSQETVTFKK